MIALTETAELLRFDSSLPGVVESRVSISGLTDGESLVGVDFRPATGQLYGVGDGGQIYLINYMSGEATAIGSPLSPGLDGTTFGVDFNPLVDRLRIVSDTGQNLRVNQLTGTVIDFDPNTAGTQPDGDLMYAPGDQNEGAMPNITGVAYNRNFSGTTSTTLYGIDATLNVLVSVNPPNNGTVNTIGDLGIDVGELVGFDVGPNGRAYASLRSAGSQAEKLYGINLNTGAATFIGAIGGTLRGTPGGLPRLTDISVVMGEEIVYATTEDGNLVSFLRSQPEDLLSSSAITGMNGETILGADFRPATGEFYVLGSSSNLYTIDLSSGAATLVAPTSVAVTGTQVGFDFNPTVDRIRIVSNDGQNLRVNPDTGDAIVDGSLAFDGADANQGATPSVTGAGYTNSFPGSTTTQLFDIDPELDILVQQNPANNGTLFTIGALGVDADGDVAFDIIEAGANSTVDYGLAAITVSGGTSASLYNVNLSTGVAATIGTIGDGTAVTSMAVAPSQFEFGRAVYNRREDKGVAVIEVFRNGGTSGAASVAFTVSAGTATAGSDFQAVSGTLIFANGESRRTIRIPLIDDAEPESVETVNIALSSPTRGAQLGEMAAAILSIYDNDGGPGNFPSSSSSFAARDRIFETGDRFALFT